MKYAILSSLFVAISCVSLLQAGPAAAEKPVITGDYVRIRMNPSLKAPTLDYLFKGNEIEISQKVNGDSYQGNAVWVKIRSDRTREGYVHSAFVAEGKEAAKFRRSLPDSVNKDILAKDFSPTQVAAIEKYRRSYFAAKTDQELSQVYLQTKKLAEMLGPVIQKKHDLNNSGNCSEPCSLKLNYLFNYVPAGIILIGGEGTVASLQVVPDIFYRRAQSTKGNYDDLFFALLGAYYGKDGPLWPAFLVRTWDYGGNSLLGQGIHLDILKKSDAVLDAGSLLNEEVEQMRNWTLKDIESSESYYEDKNTIIQEIQKILSSIKLNDQQRSMLQKRIIQFQSPEANDIVLNQKAGQ